MGHSTRSRNAKRGRAAVRRYALAPETADLESGDLEATDLRVADERDAEPAACCD